jgi:hypothetical protein
MSTEDRVRARTEDRVRAAARARTNLVTDIRPLEFPYELPERAHRPRPTRRWLNWGAPIGAAALVTALALILVMVRQADGPQSAPAPAVPVPAAPAAASIPRYYVALVDTGHASGQTEPLVGDDRTGHPIEYFTPFPGQNFTGVTAAADDRTFVLSSYQAAQRKTTLYLLRLPSGTAGPAELAKLPIKPLLAQVTGLALSPDGRELAVMSSTDPTSTNTRPQLTVYSLSSGAALGTWNANGVKENSMGPGANAAGLSWANGDRSLAFRWFTLVPGGSNYGELTVRTLDVAAAGHDLLADSRPVLRVPFIEVGGSGPGSVVSSPCHASLAASDGQAVTCGTVRVGASASSAACPGTPPSFVSYSTATGKPVQVLYQDQGKCVNGQALPLWTDPSGSRVIGLILPEGKQSPATTSFGLFAAGRFTPLPAPVGGLQALQGAASSPGGIAF